MTSCDAVIWRTGRLRESYLEIFLQLIILSSCAVSRASSEVRTFTVLQFHSLRKQETSERGCNTASSERIDAVCSDPGSSLSYRGWCMACEEKSLPDVKLFMGTLCARSLTFHELSFQGNNYSGTWELGTPKGLSKTVPNSEVVLFLRSISMCWIDLGTEVAVLNSQVVLFLRWSERQVSLYCVYQKKVSWTIFSGSVKYSGLFRNKHYCYDALLFGYEINRVWGVCDHSCKYIYMLVLW